MWKHKELLAGNSPGSGFTATMTNEALTESIAKVAKDSPDVFNRLSHRFVIQNIPLDTWDNSALQSPPRLPKTDASVVYYGGNLLAAMVGANPIRAAYDIEASRTRVPYISTSKGYFVEMNKDNE